MVEPTNNPCDLPVKATSDLSAGVRRWFTRCPACDAEVSVIDEGYRKGILKAMEIARDNEGKFASDGACKRFREILLAEIE